jgi:SAM-dependent methyltransferase
MVARLAEVEEVLDAGCGQPFLALELRDRLGLAVAGCDISDTVMDAMDSEDFRVLDLEREAWPGGRTFDCVVCSEVLEHVPDWRSALKNVCAMSHRWVLITVPGGQIRPMDRIVGHHRHFTEAMVADALRAEGLEVVSTRRWGWPVHSLYRWLISRLGADRMYESFSEARYGPSQRALSAVLWLAFFVNYAFRGGDEVVVLARHP